MKRFIFLLLLLGCLDAYSQKAAIRVNALSAIDGAFGGGISYAIGCLLYTSPSPRDA